MRREAARTALGMGSFSGAPHKSSGNGNPRADEFPPCIGWKLRLLLSLELKGNKTPKNWRSQSHQDSRRTHLFLEVKAIFFFVNVLNLSNPGS